MSNRVKLTFHWRSGADQGNPSPVEVERLLDPEQTDPMLMMDFLNDIKADLEQIYERGLVVYNNRFHHTKGPPND